MHKNWREHSYAWAAGMLTMERGVKTTGSSSRWEQEICWNGCGGARPGVFWVRIMYWAGEAAWRMFALSTTLQIRATIFGKQWLGKQNGCEIKGGGRWLKHSDWTLRRSHCFSCSGQVICFSLLNKASALNSLTEDELFLSHKLFPV